MALPRITPVSLSGPNFNMLSLENRIKSFADWTSPLVNVRELAEAGYFAAGHPVECQLPDIVRCFHCGSFAGCWLRPCDPLVEHNRMSPFCDFARMKLILREKVTAAPRKPKVKKAICRESPRIKKAKKKLFTSAPAKQ